MDDPAKRLKRSRGSEENRGDSSNPGYIMALFDDRGAGSKVPYSIIEPTWTN